MERFIKAQESDYESALGELKMGKKHSHWMWYIFPQIAGLGNTEISHHYAIKDIAEVTNLLNGSKIRLQADESLQCFTEIGNQ